MRKHFIDITEELKSTRSSWKMYLIIGLFFEFDKNAKTGGTEKFIHSIH